MTTATIVEKQPEDVLEPLIYDISVPGRLGVNLPELDVPEADLPDDLLRDDLKLPEVSELQVVRHFLKLSQLNYSIDKGFYPLGSCTMKYNPKLNEDMARLPGFAFQHPLADEAGSQGALALMYQLQNWLAEISGFDGVSLTPAAGAQGEFAGILMIRNYHLDRGDTERTKILVPNSAHGTNPATVTMAGYSVIELPSDDRGDVDLDALRKVCKEQGPQIAGMMITVPSTLGLFDAHILEVIEIVHAAGGLMYMDGANMNALMGQVKPGELGFDVMHYNLHKTFSTPHGGGGPGSGPVGVNEKLKPFLPGPIVDIVEESTEEDEAPLYGFVMPEKSIGRMKAFHGNFGMHVRAYAYIRVYGGEGLRDVSRHAVLNANYIRAHLMDTYKVPYPRYCGHEFVMEGHLEGADDIHALDISKRLMDYGYHPPTNYFPLIVPEALLIEPTETETKEVLDEFIDAMKKIAEEARTNPDLLHNAPHTAPVKRLDEVKAAKDLVLCCAPALPDGGAL
ncbi:aminomethyl-transferring glycine dehydrogenase subunit GcvPB [Phototrophicus methaneseepsis]|uniref:Probable glycine dehydrogenase (decarboxylating) subunit 2 n=1 Tax=Phototrophicus methaneseepsis TaxID=2710758 RepID=A0A7S8IDW7_9CHLR|nr:aminomethyl-transferring glycine dehydrogenase subunit GcvPB [Phototrophicus methaneseepsis]QPC81794.1 aminomethyl-transferring glycine dehydrogenase subunit GcvPB [Phototrophicus methaneseepsis]